MNNEILQHHGILGMKWGVRRTPEQLRRSKKISSTDTSDEKSSNKKRVKDMSDEELRKMIGRLELEKRYKDLSNSLNREKTAKGKQFVMDVMEKSGKNIATQFATYAMGTAVNKLIGNEIVNPKKGQKDK